MPTPNPSPGPRPSVREHGFVDLSARLLPLIDDGPTRLSDAVQVATAAEQHGTDFVVLTPRYQDHAYLDRRAQCESAFALLRQHLAERGLALDLALAGTCRFDASLQQAIMRDEVPWLGHFGSDRVVLIEVPKTRLPKAFEQAVAWMRRQRVRPMIAGAEHNHELAKHPERLRALIDQGALVQVCADSLAGGRGPFAQVTAQRMLVQGTVHVLASEGSDLGTRPPWLEPGRIAAAALVGEEVAEALVFQTPAQIASFHFPQLTLL